MGRVRWWAAATAAVLVVGTASGCGASTTSQKVEAIRTTADGRGLVAAYIGGSCDESTRLVVHEHPDHVEIAVETRESSGACDAAGHSRTVAASLAAPLGAREVRTDSGTMPVFDGSRLRGPSPVPAGFAPDRQGGWSATPNSWTLTYGTATAPSADRCTPGRGILQIDQSPVGADLVGDMTTVGLKKFGTVTASLYRRGTGPGASWALTWAADGGEIALLSQAACDGDRPLDGDQLVALAQTLQPLQ